MEEENKKLKKRIREYKKKLREADKAIKHHIALSDNMRLSGAKYLTKNIGITKENKELKEKTKDLEKKVFALEVNLEQQIDENYELRILINSIEKIKVYDTRKNLEKGKDLDLEA